MAESRTSGSAALALELIERIDDVAVGWAAGEVPWAFSDGLPPNRACRFRSTRLSSASNRDARSCGMSRMDGDVAVVACNQGLSLARGHLLDRGRDRLAAMLLKVLQVAHVMDLHAVMRAAQLAGVRQQSFEHLCPGVPGMRRSVVEDCVYPPSE